MENKISKRFIILLSSVLLLAPVEISDACGGYDYSMEEEISMSTLISPEISGLTDLNNEDITPTPYYYHPNYEGDNSYGNVNTKEWMAYFGEPANHEEIYKFVYQSSEENF